MKVWRFFTNDFAKILSIIAMVLSIIATITTFKDFFTQEREAELKPPLSSSRGE